MMTCVCSRFVKAVPPICGPTVFHAYGVLDLSFPVSASIMYLAARPSTLRTYAGYFLSAQPKLLIDSTLVYKPLCLMNSLKCPMSWRDVNMFDSRWPSSFQGATHLNSPDLTASRKHLRAHSLWLSARGGAGSGMARAR